MERATIECPMCGTTFKRWGPLKRFCSRACQLRSRNEATQIARRGAHVCLGCGTVFEVGYPDKRRNYCSRECARRRQNRIIDARRDAIERSGGTATIEAFDPLVVLERDGWRCQDCGCDTPRELRGSTDPRAPEVDHVVALNHQGPHTIGNAQCLCRRCNRIKGRAERRRLALNGEALRGRSDGDFSR